MTIHYLPSGNKLIVGSKIAQCAHSFNVFAFEDIKVNIPCACTIAIFTIKKLK